MGKSAEEILHEYGQRKQENLTRNREYGILYGIYEGLFNRDAKDIDAMDGRGRPILRDSRQKRGEQGLVANLLKAIVDDYVSMTSVLPDIKVPEAPFADISSFIGSSCG